MSRFVNKSKTQHLEELHHSVTLRFRKACRRWSLLRSCEEESAFQRIYSDRVNYNTSGRLTPRSASGHSREHLSRVVGPAYFALAFAGAGGRSFPSRSRSTHAECPASG